MNRKHHMPGMLNIIVICEVFSCSCPRTVAQNHNKSKPQLGFRYGMPLQHPAAFEFFYSSTLKIEAIQQGENPFP